MVHYSHGRVTAARPLKDARVFILQLGNGSRHMHITNHNTDGKTAQDEEEELISWSILVE